MKIGFVLDSHIDHCGGVQRFVKGLYSFLESEGHEAVIFTGGKSSVTESQGYRVFSLGRTISLSGNDAQISVFADWVDSDKILSLLQKEKVDILHLQGVFGLLGMRFLDCSSLPSVCTFHNFWEEERLPSIYKPLFSILDAFIRRVDVRVADSRSSRDLMKQISPGDYKIIYPGTAVDIFSSALPERVFSKKDLINILYVGRLDERKGLMFLLEALRKICRGGLGVKNIPNFSLTVVGSGPLLSEAEKFVLDCNLPRIKFLGFVEEERLLRIYKGADIFCSPAIHGECFGLVLVEAMSAGLPIVAFDNAGYREVLSGRGEEFLASSEDVSDLARLLTKLLREESLRQEMSSWSQKQAQKFSWEVSGYQYLKIYENLLV